MKVIFGLFGSIILALVITIFVGIVITYSLLFINFSGPESVVGPCFEAGFSVGLICGLTAGFFVARHFWLEFWREYSSSEDE